jgi:hypothetical protein
VKKSAKEIWMVFTIYLFMFFYMLLFNVLNHHRIGWLASYVVHVYCLMALLRDYLIIYIYLRRDGRVGK